MQPPDLGDALSPEPCEKHRGRFRIAPSVSAAQYGLQVGRNFQAELLLRMLLQQWEIV